MNKPILEVNETKTTNNKQQTKKSEDVIKGNKFIKKTISIEPHTHTHTHTHTHKHTHTRTHAHIHAHTHRKEERT